MTTFANAINAIVTWLIEEPAFSWFAGSGFAFIWCCVSLGFILATIFCKKLRNIIF